MSAHCLLIINSSRKFDTVIFFKQQQQQHISIANKACPIRCSSVLALCVIVSSHVLNCYELHANFLSIGCGAHRTGSQETEIFLFLSLSEMTLGKKPLPPAQRFAPSSSLLKQTLPRAPGSRTEREGWGSLQERTPQFRIQAVFSRRQWPARSKVQRKPHQGKRE